MADKYAVRDILMRLPGQRYQPRCGNYFLPLPYNLVLLIFLALRSPFLSQLPTLIVITVDLWVVQEWPRAAITRVSEAYMDTNQTTVGLRE